MRADGSEKVFKNDAIKSFIPTIEIYRDAEGQLYVWSDELELEIFNDICGKFQEDIRSNAAGNLIFLLNAIKYLTQCVCELHKVGLVHRDIKPANFGFVRRGGEILPQTISLFDIDSICSVYNNPRGTVGTIGFCEFTSVATNLTDIYSIGATMFYSLIGTNYTDADFIDMKYLVDNCPIARNFVTAMQYHLYETPLHSRQSTNALNIALVGFGYRAQVFLDTALTLGQLPKTDLSVTINSDRRDEFDLYLENRPELKNFFAIDGEDVADNYGRISFEQCDLSTRNRLYDLLVKQPNYVFIALDDEEKNRLVSQWCREIGKELELDCLVVCADELKLRERNDDIERQSFKFICCGKKTADAVGARSSASFIVPAIVSLACST